MAFNNGGGCEALGAEVLRVGLKGEGGKAGGFGEGGRGDLQGDFGGIEPSVNRIGKGNARGIREGGEGGTCGAKVARVVEGDGGEGAAEVRVFRVFVEGGLDAGADGGEVGIGICVDFLLQVAEKLLVAGEAGFAGEAGADFPGSVRRRGGDGLGERGPWAGVLNEAGANPHPRIGSGGRCVASAADGGSAEGFEKGGQPIGWRGCLRHGDAPELPGDDPCIGGAGCAGDGAHRFVGEVELGDGGAGVGGDDVEGAEQAGEAEVARIARP